MRIAILALVGAFLWSDAAQPQSVGGWALDAGVTLVKGQLRNAVTAASSPITLPNGNCEFLIVLYHGGAGVYPVQFDRNRCDKVRNKIRVGSAVWLKGTTTLKDEHGEDYLLARNFRQQTRGIMMPEMLGLPHVHSAVVVMGLRNRPKTWERYRSQAEPGALTLLNDMPKMQAMLGELVNGGALELRHRSPLFQEAPDPRALLAVPGGATDEVDFDFRVLSVDGSECYVGTGVIGTSLQPCPPGTWERILGGGFQAGSTPARQPSSGHCAAAVAEVKRDLGMLNELSRRVYQHPIGQMVERLGVCE